MKHVQARRFIYKVGGGCQPSIVEACDGSFYVLKLAAGGNPNLFFNEAFGARLIQRFHLPVAAWAPVKLTDGFIDSNPELWPLEGRYSGRPSAGLHFGSKLITPKRGIGAFQLIPSSWLSRVINAEDFVRILALDIWGNHCDRRQAVFTTAGSRFRATFIDNENMFGGPRGTDTGCPRRAMTHDLKLYRNLPVAAILNAWRHKIGAVSERTLRSFLGAIPAAWYTAEMAERVIDELLSRRVKLPALFAEAVEVIQTGASTPAEQFVSSIAART